MNLQHSETWSSHAGNNPPSHSIIGTHSTKSFLGLFSYHFILFFPLWYSAAFSLFVVLTFVHSQIYPYRISHSLVIYLFIYFLRILIFFRWYIKKSIKQMCVFNPKKKKRKRIRAIIKASLKQNIRIKGKWEIFVQEIWKND